MLLAHLLRDGLLIGHLLLTQTYPFVRNRLLARPRLRGVEPGGQSAAGVALGVEDTSGGCSRSVVIEVVGRLGFQLVLVSVSVSR